MPDFALDAPVTVHGDATFARDGLLRCELRRWWVDRPKCWAAWLMLNPSHAGKRKDDPTMSRVIRFSQAWGYDGCIVGNLYPFISSDPREMWVWSKWQERGPDWYTRDDLQANLANIEAIGRKSALRMVAFGSDPMSRDYNWVEEAVERFTQPFDYPLLPHVEAPMCLGTTLNGGPLHPLARGKWLVPDSAYPKPWSFFPGLIKFQGLSIQ